MRIAKMPDVQEDSWADATIDKVAEGDFLHDACQGINHPLLIIWRVDLSSTSERISRVIVKFIGKRKLFVIDAVTLKSYRYYKESHKVAYRDRPPLHRICIILKRNDGYVWPVHYDKSSIGDGDEMENAGLTLFTSMDTARLFLSKEIFSKTYDTASLLDLDLDERVEVVLKDLQKSPLKFVQHAIYEEFNLGASRYRRSDIDGWDIRSIHGDSWIRVEDHDMLSNLRNAYCEWKKGRIGGETEESTEGATW